MTRTAAVDRPDFHAWRAYRAIVDAETAAEQAAVFQFQSEGRARVGVWIHGGPTDGIRIGAVLTTATESVDEMTGAFRKGRSYTAVADARLANGALSQAPPIVKGLDSRQAAAALLLGRWIERRARHQANHVSGLSHTEPMANRSLAVGSGGGGVPGRPELLQVFGDPRALWPSEVRDMVPWIVDNFDLLGQCLDLRLTLVGREVWVGECARVDLVAEDEAGRKIVIEVQHGPSDHEHLGKTIVYTQQARADMGVWIVAGDIMQDSLFRYEHTNALALQNRQMAGLAEFAAVELTLESDLFAFDPSNEQDPPLIPRFRRFDLLTPDLRARFEAALPPIVIPEKPEPAPADATPV